MAELRVVSLLASATEIVCALGFRNALVARSHECDYPPEVESLPTVTESKLDAGQPSRAVDDAVKGIVEQGLSVYRVDAERLRALRPDVIVTQTQCEVCAVSPRDLELALRDWTGTSPRVVSLEPNRLEDVWRDMLAVAAALDATPAGLGLVARMRRRMEGIARVTQGIVHHPTVACVEWIDPLMAAGNWMPELVAMAGGRDLFGRAGEHSPWLGWDELRRANPEVIVIQPCGYDIPRARREMPVLTGAAGWDGLRAVGAGRVFLVDGNRYFNRPGPGLVESLEILVELLHPGRMRFGHEGRGWQRL